MDKIVLPFVHVQERGDEKTANLEKRVQLARLTENESRVVLQFNRNINFDPSASFSLKTTMNNYYAMFVLNILMGMSGGLFGPDIKLYVTHNLKQIAGISITDSTNIRALRSVVEEYLEDTLQQPEDFALALVMDTDRTVHTEYMRAEVLDDEGPFVVLHMLDGYVIPWSQDYASTLLLHYPIEIVVADMNLGAIYTGDGVYQIDLTARVAGSENKRAVL